MNELQIFKNNQFGNVRIVMKEQEPWFVAKDVYVIVSKLTTQDRH